MSVRPAVPADVSGIARVHLESWKSTYAGLMPADYLAALRLEDRERLWRANFGKPAGPILVAEEAGEVVGFAYGGPNRGRESDFAGELYALYVLDRLQRRGLGRSLLLRFVEALGAPSMVVWVMEGNPACGFYEAMGGARLASKKIMIGGAFLTERSYGWSESSSILDFRVRIADPDTGWPRIFESERGRLEAALGEEAVAIEHIGSTAVPGLAAKPIIDILAGVARYPLTPTAIESVAALGYVHRGEAGIAERQYFVKRGIHLHVAAHGAGFWRSHVAFRDRLRADPEEARAYEALKRRLAEEMGDDRAAYSAAKAPFIERVLARP